MLKNFLSQLEKELINRNPRITGIKLVDYNRRNRRVHILVFVLQFNCKLIWLPVTLAIDYYPAGKIQQAAGLVLQAVDLGTWGPRDFRVVRDSVSVTA